MYVLHNFLKSGTNTEDKGFFFFSEKVSYNPGWLQVWYVAKTTFQLSLLPSSKTTGMRQHTLVYEVLRSEHRASCIRGKHSTN